MAETSKPARGPGRPRKSASDAKRSTLTFRVRDGMYERLLASAEKRELSISEEIERRLQRSFSLGSLYDGQRETEDLTALVSSVINYAQVRSGKTWLEDVDTRLIVAKSLRKVADIVEIGEFENEDTGNHIDSEARLGLREALNEINPAVGVDPRIKDFVGPATDAVERMEAEIAADRGKGRKA